ncbi:MAG TPA: radical SAM protein [Candidatus Omnitrophota bacterium]|nr:radical SAM protein [Candidatus Omnitrophota bacterium]HPN55588.1 radical SAM protein [Candidatus Omnitrophota bacterium]
MSKKNFKYIFGPVPSWRLGSSLGIDPVSKGRKVCSFDCVYCQLGKTGLFTDERMLFVPCKEVIKELESVPALNVDYITFSGACEPTLAENFGEMIKAVKGIRREKIAVFTNASLLSREDVREDLLPADFVIVKLDASSQEVLTAVNRPTKIIVFENIVAGIKLFRKDYKGRLALQIMFIEQNKAYAQDIARIAQEIHPDEVQINTPLRPSRVKPLSQGEIDRISRYFDGLNIVSVYKAQRRAVQPISDEETLKRRGKI